MQGKTEDDPSRIELRNITSPDPVARVDRTKHMPMPRALMAVLPKDPPGRTPANARAALLAHPNPVLLPGGAKADRWLTCLELALASSAPAPARRDLPAGRRL